MRKLLTNKLKKYFKIDRVRNTNDHILCFHRIIASMEDRTDYMGTYEYLVSDFELLIQYYLGIGYQFVELNEITNQEKEMINRKRVCLTFDDGYRDLLYLILPLLQKYEIPATIYVVPGYVERTLPKWDYALNYIFADKDVLNKILNELPALNKSAVDFSMTSEVILYQVLKDTLKSFNNNHHFEMIAQFAALCPSQTQKANNLMLDADELRSLSDSEFITVGCHSTSHFVMTDISDNILNEEIENCKYYVEKLLDHKAEHFCFPYGAASVREFEAIEALGFKTGVTTLGRNLRRNSRDHATSLPRYVVRIDDTINDIERWLKYRSFL